MFIDLNCFSQVRDVDNGTLVFSVSSGTVVSAKSQPPPELPPEPTAEGINFIRVYKLSDISFMSCTLNILKSN